MLKLPKPSWIRNIKRFAAAAFIAEGLCFAGSYYFWYRLNTNREFRHYCHQNYPFVLEGYYKVGEFFDTANSVEQTRQQDLAVWQALEKPPQLK